MFMCMHRCLFVQTIRNGYGEWECIALCRLATTLHVPLSACKRHHMDSVISACRYVK
jgi:hypothetical protein